MARTRPPSTVCSSGPWSGSPNPARWGPFQRLGGRVLVALDGTEHFCSRKIRCEQCSHRRRSDGGTEHFHAFLGASQDWTRSPMIAPAASVRIFRARFFRRIVPPSPVKMRSRLSNYSRHCGCDGPSGSDPMLTLSAGGG
jgi:hypothetical protein